MHNLISASLSDRLPELREQIEFWGSSQPRNNCLISNLLALFFCLFLFLITTAFWLHSQSWERSSYITPSIYCRGNWGRMRGSGPTKVSKIVKWKHWGKSQALPARGRTSGKCALGPRVQCGDQVRRKKVGRERYTPCCNFTHDLYTARDNRRESTPVPVSVSIP